MDTELFELCKSVYEKTGWDETDKFWHSLISHDMKSWSEYKLQDYKPASLFGMRIVPLYTSDYLLQKLRDCNEFSLFTNGTVWQARYLGKPQEEWANIPQWQSKEADTPLKALLKLTLELHEAGELQS
jgi:hypothetical protein